MRGFDFSQVNILYNDIYIGPQSFTSRVMDTFVLDRVEFLKGPSSLMSGIGATGGAVNYVNKSPTTGPVYMFVDFDKPLMFPAVDSARLTFRARNLTNRVYDPMVGPGLPGPGLFGGAAQL